MEKKVLVLEKELSVGDFDPTEPGCYRNVVPLSFDVKPKRKITVEVVSQNPVDVVIAYSNGSSATHKNGVTEAKIGPVNTMDSNNMGMLLGVYPGDKTMVSLKIWMEK